MQRLKDWIPVAGWGLAVAGAVVVFVSGGCGILRNAIRNFNERHQPPVTIPSPDTRPLPSP